MTTGERIRPFSNGSQFSDWQAANCRGCARYREDLATTCELDRALIIAYCSDGTIAHDIATRLGCFTNDLEYPAAHCPEWRDPTAEALAADLARLAEWNRLCQS